MKQFYIVSAVGKDRPGLVNRVTQLIHGLGGNIELQRSNRMASEFAMLLLFSLENPPDDLVDQFKALNSDTLYVSARSAVAESHAAEGARSLHLIASGADQPGIVEAVTLVLFKEQVNIESMDYDTESAPFTGDLLFRMKARLMLPEGLDQAELRNHLRELEDEYNFDILLEP